MLEESAVVAGDDVRYELVRGWERPVPGLSHPDVAAVATTSNGDVYLFCRTDPPVQIFDRSGAFLGAWGAGEFAMPRGPHGMYIDESDHVYLVDETGHTVRKYTADGRQLAEFGTRDVPSDTGHAGGVAGSGIVRAAGPFNRPTNVMPHPNGSLYATDGYGNARVHRFDADGALRTSWGEPGSSPGEFIVPHGLTVDDTGRIIVADRENDRLQIFTAEGVFVEEWLDVQRPCDVVVDADGWVYVAELCRLAGDVTTRHGIVDEFLPGRVSVFDRDGTLRLRWGGQDIAAPGNFVAPHAIWVDDERSIYVAEVTETMGVRPGRVPPGTHTIQKFARL